MSCKVKPEIIYQELLYYFKSIYGPEIKIFLNEDKNYGSDWLLRLNSFLLFIEVKTRGPYSSDCILKENDVLIELIQNVPYLQVNTHPVYGQPLALSNLNNRTVEHVFHSDNIIKAVGWFFKCNADRVIFIRFLGDRAYDIIDIAYKGYFKEWFYHNAKNFELNYSNLTTGTINLKVPIKDIPSPFVIHKKLNTERKITELPDSIIPTLQTIEEELGVLQW